jgi:hypothetical protein
VTLKNEEDKRKIKQLSKGREAGEKMELAQLFL